MREGTITADRLTAFSDAAFAVIVTIMVLYSCGRYAGVRTTDAACGEAPDHLLSLRASRPQRWLRSSRRA